MASYGRGGAGNFQAVELAKSKISTDLEANHRAAEACLQAPSPSDVLAKEPQQYAYRGRGGMGNLYSPKELKEAAPTRVEEYIVQSAEKTTRTAGRGGAGNYEFATNESKSKAEHERTKEAQSREQLKRDMYVIPGRTSQHCLADPEIISEKQVQEKLAMNQKAKLLGGEQY